jgi:hypothetical protein
MKNKKLKLKKKNCLILLTMLLSLWVAASTIDVNCHNDITKEDYSAYASWNFFTLMEQS